MKKLIVRFIVMCFLAVSLTAFAQTSPDVSKDNMKQSTPASPKTPKGTQQSAKVKHTSTKKDSTTKDNMKPDTMKKDTTKKDTMKKDDAAAPKQ
jgi:pentapeptide MXKDX repeat protein